jgi:hypothetical protein
MLEFPTLAFIIIDIREKFHEEIGGTASHMHQRAFFTQPESRCHCKTLFILATVTGIEV